MCANRMIELCVYVIYTVIVGILQNDWCMRVEGHTDPMKGILVYLVG